MGHRRCADGKPGVPRFQGLPAYADMNLAPAGLAGATRPSDRGEGCFAPPCRGRFIRPRPLILMPALAASLRAFWRLGVLKPGTSQPRPDRLSTKPAIRLSAMPDSTFIARTSPDRGAMCLAAGHTCRITAGPNRIVEQRPALRHFIAGWPVPVLQAGRACSCHPATRLDPCGGSSKIFVQQGFVHHPSHLRNKANRPAKGVVTIRSRR